MAASVGLFFGSDTGNTETVARLIQQELGKAHLAVQDIAKSTPQDLAAFDLLILGIPTWYYGEAQADWDDFFADLAGVDFNGKVVAIFGCGDQEDYADYFLDAMGTLYEKVVAQGAIVVGQWPITGYQFDASRAVIEPGYFVGLGIDEDRQPQLTAERVRAWCQQLREEMCLAELGV